MLDDPFTLRVVLSKDDTATGDLYLDDGKTYSHQQGQYVWRQFVAEKTKKGGKSTRISSIDLGMIKPTEAVEGAPALTSYDPKNAYAKTQDERNVRVEKFIVLGLKSKPKSVKVEGTGEELVWDYISGAGSAEKKGGMASTLIIKDPKLKITSDRSVVIW